ncbi:MAG: putative peptidoglycan binding domain [Pseudomonadota bacterium]|jgi:peptidoglycan hydrolase-like protein with peptidoglycan-binding domain
MATEIQAGLRQGDTGAAVDHLQAHLRRYGYIAAASAAEAFGMRSFPGPRGLVPVEGEPTAGSFDDATTEALRSYQRFNRLPESGELDVATPAS